MRFRGQGCAWGALALVLLFSGCPVLAQEAPEEGNRQYRAAAELQRGGQYELAVAAWNDFLAKHQNHVYVPQATLNLGICYLKAKQYDKALATLERVLEKHPNAAFREAAYLHLGATQFSLGREGQQEQYAEAARTLDTLLRRYPEGRYLAPALYYRGECDYALGKKDSAAIWYARLIEKFPNDRLAPDALYALGTTLEELGRFQAAGSAYDRFLVTSPNHPRAVEVGMRRGETFFRTGQFPLAIERFAKAAASQGFSLADRALVRQADCLGQMKRYVEAAGLYTSVAQRFPNSGEIEGANLAAGKCYYLAGQWDKALAILTKVIAARRRSFPEATHWSARSLLKQGKPAEAVSLLEKTLSEVGGSEWESQLRLDLADATYAMPNLRGISVPLYADVAKRFPEDPVADSARYMAAFAAMEQGDYAAAGAYAEQFIKSYPASNLLPDVMAVAAECELQLGKLDEAQRRYQILVGRYPNHQEAASWRLRRGLILYMLKRYAETIAAIQPIIGRLSSQAARAEAYYLLGSSLLRQQRFDEAVEALRMSVLADAHWPQADDTLLLLADALRRQGKPAEAGDTLRRLLVSFPKSPLLDQAHYWLAELAYDAGDIPVAIRDYQTVVQGWPKSKLAPHALFGLGWAQLSRKEFAAAEATFDRLVSGFPKSELVAQARFARGTARQQLGKFSQAIDDVQALLAAGPTGKEKSDALYVLGSCQAGLNKNDEAITTFEKLLADDLQYAGRDRVLDALAWALAAAGRPKEAIDRFVELSKEYPTSPLAAESLYHAAELYDQQKQYDKAVEIYESVAAKTTDAGLKEKALHKLAWAQFGAGEFDKARAAFEAQRTAVPGGELVADAAFMEGECLARLGKREEALVAYERMLALPQKPLEADFTVLARLHAAEAAGELKQWDKAVALLTRAAQESPKSPYLPEVLFERARVEEKLGHADAAAKLYAAVPGKTNREVAAKAQFALGVMLSGQKKPAEAIRAFYEVIYGGWDYPRWQAEATYEAAKCFEAMAKPEQAAKLYQELLDKFPKSDKAAAAKGRLDALEKK